MNALQSVHAATQDRQKASALLTELQVVIQQQEVVACLPTVSAMLRSALLACKATQELRPAQEFQQKEKVAPGKKLDLQWRFRKIKKDPGRKKGQKLKCGSMKIVVHAQVSAQVYIPYMHAPSCTYNPNTHRLPTSDAKEALVKKLTAATEVITSSSNSQIHRHVQNMTD